MRNHFRKYLPSARASFSIFRIKSAEGFQYRIAGLAGASTSIIYGLIEITVYSVFYHYAEHPSAGILAGLTLSQVVSYAWLAQVLFLMQPMSIDSDILNKIVSGDVGIEMCRPLDLYFHWFAKIAAGRLSPILWRGSIVLLASMLMPISYRLSPPASLPNFLLTLFSFLSAFLLCTAFGTFVCVIRLNITWGEGPTYIIMLLGGVLSGSYLPLQLWPEFMQKFLLFQPFAGYLDIPLRLYLGTIPLNQAFGAIALQLLWAAAFILIGRRIMNLRIKKIIVQGG
jgi:ABC-2 type transport system permease protein